jgi:hypothetical protein
MSDEVERVLREQSERQATEGDVARAEDGSAPAVAPSNTVN